MNDTRKLTAEEKCQKLKELYGAQMSNLLYYVKSRSDVPLHIRTRAEELQKKWDSVCDLKLLNPISVVELEKALR